MRIGLLGLALTLIAGTVSAQIGTWKSYTSMQDVRSHVRDGNRYWVATIGGMFLWDGASGEFESYTNAEGLLDNDLTAIAIDRDGDIWSGAESGVIHVLHPGGAWSYVLDISTSAQANKRINRLVMHGDTLLVCTGFGLSLFDPVDFLFGDTYTKFGSLTNVRVSVADAVVFRDSLWALVSDGQTTHRVAVASLADPNRLPAEAWTLRSVGPSGVPLTALEVFDGRLFAGTTAGVYELTGGQWNPVAGLEATNVVAIDGTGPRMLVCSAGSVLSMDAQGSFLQFPLLPTDAQSVGPDDAGNPVIGSADDGLLTLDGDWSGHFPNSPGSNQFVSVIVDDDGDVWCATGMNGSGRGIMRFDGQSWKTFTKANSALPTDDYFHVSAGCDGSVWASSWGWGVLEIPKGAEEIDTSLVFGRNVGMEGLAVNPDYIVVTDVVCDPVGNEWMSINQSQSGEILAIREADGETWTTLQLTYGSIRVSTLFYNIFLDKFFAVDAFGNIWGGSRDLTYKGVFTLGNRGAVTGTISSLITEQDGLPSNEITTVVVDRENDVWVGTERGIGIILDPNDPERPGAIALYKPLNGLVVNTIAVDALNRKWVGTTDGVVVLSSDGIQLLESYNVASTGGKLISDDVRSIAIDNRNGTVYFGTPVGLSSLTTVAADPKAEFDQLEISPNPFVLPASGDLLIDGLVENSTVKILRLDGSLIREVTSPGGRVGFWDGKDRDGNEVASGVYIVVAYSPDGGKVATGKVAVVRK